jgi:methylmalonyl-CoA mutase N-terminal domain/subunit
VESGQLHRRIAAYFTEQQRRIEAGELKIVGQNAYRSGLEPPPINVFRYPEGVENAQKARLERLRATRDGENVRQTLSALRDACSQGKNILPFTLACARARCTEGEVFKVFKEAFGLWKPPSLW